MIATISDLTSYEEFAGMCFLQAKNMIAAKIPYQLYKVYGLIIMSKGDDRL